MSAEGPAPTTPILDVLGIQKLIPHRWPFLLVDRVVVFEKDTRLVGIKGVTVNEPFFVGHFPDKPVMPGVLVLEALAQAAALLAKMSMAEGEGEGMLTYLMGIDDARFRRPVLPGDRLELHVEVTKHKGAVWKEKGSAVVDGQVCAEAEFMAMLVHPKDA